MSLTYQRFDPRWRSRVRSGPGSGVPTGPGSSSTSHQKCSVHPRTAWTCGASQSQGSPARDCFRHDTAAVTAQHFLSTYGHFDIVFLSLGPQEFALGVQRERSQGS